LNAFCQWIISPITYDIPAINTVGAIKFEGEWNSASDDYMVWIGLWTVMALFPCSDREVCILEARMLFTENWI
jgi:hypothetical protein